MPSYIMLRKGRSVVIPNDQELALYYKDPDAYIAKVYDKSENLKEVLVDQLPPADPNNNDPNLNQPPNNGDPNSVKFIEIPEGFESFLKDDLIELATTLNIDPSGTKPEIIDRISEYQASDVYQLLLMENTEKLKDPENLEKSE